MNRLIILSIFISSALITGCASVSKAPTEKSDAAKSFEAPADRGTVYLYRTGRAVGAAGQLSVKFTVRMQAEPGRDLFLNGILNLAFIHFPPPPRKAQQPRR